MFLGLPLALFGCLVLVCLVVAVYAYAKKLLGGLPRKRRNTLLFHKIDENDEASAELSASYDDDDDDDDDDDEDDDDEKEKGQKPDYTKAEERKVELSGMRASVLTSMM